MVGFVAHGTPFRRPGRQRPLVTTLAPPTPVSAAALPPRAALTRRTALATAAAAAVGLLLGGGDGGTARPPPAGALDFGPSKAELLNRASTGRTKEEAAAARAAAVEERQARLEAANRAAAERESSLTGSPSAAVDAIEPTLRGSYYSPTAKLRYLPRVRLAAESLDSAVVAAARGDWATLTEMASPTGALGDAAAPMRLYASSLSGQGLSIASRAAKEMDAAGADYAAAIARLTKGAKKRSSGTVGGALDDLRASMNAYRRAGRMDTDWGLSEISTTQRVGAAFSNNNPVLYSRNSGGRGSNGGLAPTAGAAAGQEPAVPEGGGAAGADGSTGLASATARAEGLRATRPVRGKLGVGLGPASGSASATDSREGLLDSGAASGAATLGAGAALGKGW
ncbi:hypothetical protein MMPV_006626 [Pyropia vietnamensis]